MSNKNIYTNNPFELLANGFVKLFQNNRNLTIFITVYSLIELSFSFSQRFFSNLMQALLNRPPELLNIKFALVLVAFFLILVFIFLQTIVSGMSAYLAYINSKNKSTTIKQAFRKSLSKFWIILCVNLVVAFKIILGLIFFIVPGIRAMTRYNFSLIYIFDENTSVKQSIKKSRELSKDHLIEILGLMMWSGIIPVISSITTIGSKSEIYRQLKILKSAPHKIPPIHWLNYLIVILSLVALITIALFISMSYILMATTFN